MSNATLSYDSHMIGHIPFCNHKISCVKSGATGLSVSIGTRRPEAETLHPQSSGDSSWLIHSYTAWYTRYEWYLADALLGGSVSNLKTGDREVLLNDLLYMMYLFWSRVLALPSPYSCRWKSPPCWATSTCVLPGDVNTSRIWELLCDFIIWSVLVFPFIYEADVGVAACHNMEKQDVLRHTCIGRSDSLDIYELNGAMTVEQMDIAIWSR